MSEFFYDIYIFFYSLSLKLKLNHLLMPKDQNIGKHGYIDN